MLYTCILVTPETHNALGTTPLKEFVNARNTFRDERLVGIVPLRELLSKSNCVTVVKVPGIDPTSLLANRRRDLREVMLERALGIDPVYKELVRNSDVSDDRPPRDDGNVPPRLLKLASIETRLVS